MLIIGCSVASLHREVFKFLFEVQLINCALEVVLDEPIRQELLINFFTTLISLSILWLVIQPRIPRSYHIRPLGWLTWLVNHFEGLHLAVIDSLLLEELDWPVRLLLGLDQKWLVQRQVLSGGLELLLFALISEVLHRILHRVFRRHLTAFALVLYFDFFFNNLRLVGLLLRQFRRRWLQFGLIGWDQAIFVTRGRVSCQKHFVETFFRLNRILVSSCQQGWHDYFLPRSLVVCFWFLFELVFGV